MKKILVANRGEIALRIMRSAKEMGISTVAVYSEADRNAPFVKYADEAVCLGPAPSSQSYLRGDKIIEVCKQLGVDGIHPGYGFLSENAGFAELAEKHGITFIGPKPHSIEVMGSKLEAKHAARKYNIPMVPGTEGAVDDVEEAKRVALEIGLPVLIKASAGGGGKGMRTVEHIEDLAEQMERAISEAQNSFGDGSVFIERYVTSPRHIEIQILADSHGNVVYLFERECSIQRRHQKVIEEAPAPGIDRRLIAKIGERCAEACRKIGYRGAGTFEFLYENDEFYFIEMNTRVQVEHPVTELITGIDIVQQQIHIAAGEKLPFRQKDIEFKGHAIECRINAEDPVKFMPSPGRIQSWHMPGGPGIRVDSHAYAGYFVPPTYDSMIGKLIAYGATREQAIRRMRIALSEVAIDGILTNIPLHRELMLDPKFEAGGTSIHYLEHKLEEQAASRRGNTK